jgi:hypothetical protein
MTHVRAVIITKISLWITEGFVEHRGLETMLSDIILHFFPYNVYDNIWLIPLVALHMMPGLDSG